MDRVGDNLLSYTCVVPSNVILCWRATGLVLALHYMNHESEK